MVRALQQIYLHLEDTIRDDLHQCIQIHISSTKSPLGQNIKSTDHLNHAIMSPIKQMTCVQMCQKRWWSEHASQWIYLWLIWNTAERTRSHCSRPERETYSKSNLNKPLFGDIPAVQTFLFSKFLRNCLICELSQCNHVPSL